MRYPLTIDGVERVLAALGYQWRGPWQREAADAICNYEEVVFQAARQEAGKTFTSSIVGATTIIAGGTVTHGSPTQAQSSRLLTERTTSYVNTFGTVAATALGRKFFRRPREQTTYQRWTLADAPTHEGKLYSLSANEIAVHKPEGYTTDHLYLDESHRLTMKTLGIFEPFLDIAQEQGLARIVYLGVGGHKSSLIEQKKLQPGVKVVYWPADRIAAADPRWVPVFERRKASMPPWQYRQNYDCLPTMEGMLLMFPDGIPGAIDITDWIKRGVQPVYYFGIDVGKVVDSTVVKVIAVSPGYKGRVVNEVGTFEITGCSYVDQAAAIFKYIDGGYPWRRENIIVELNGVGQAFYDILCDGPFRGIRGINTTADLKEVWWNEMNRMIREGRFGCKREASRLHYEGMMYENVYRGGKFVVDFEHSDYWMALNMALSGLSEIEAL